MIYLIIPIVIFTVFAICVWAVTGRVREETLSCGIEDLDVLLSVLMTSGYDRSALKIHRAGKRIIYEEHVFLKMKFPGPQVQLEVPLAPRGALHSMDEALSVLRRVGLDARENADGSGLQCEIEGPPSQASAVIAEIVDALIKVPFEMEVHAHNLDHDVIDQALTEWRQGAPLPVAATHGSEPETKSPKQTGYMLTLVDFLLLPIPFLIASA